MEAPDLPPPPAAKVILIAVYNYKGGVGKTTTTINLGAALAASGHRTLLVDADPQCNLSTFFGEDDEEDEDDDDANDNDDDEAAETEAHPAREADAMEEEGRVRQHVNIGVDELQYDKPLWRRKLNNFHYDEVNTTLHSALRQVFIGHTDRFRERSALPLDELIQVGDELYLLQGSPRLVEFESPLARPDRLQAVRQLGCFRKLLVDTAVKNAIEFVVIDLGPSSGVLNKVFVMSCDYILPVANADRMSVCSTEGLLRSVLPMWEDWFRTIKQEERERLHYDTDAQDFVFVSQPPRVLPVIVTSYHVRDKLRNGPFDSTVRNPYRDERSRPIRTLTLGPSIWCRSLNQLVRSVALSSRPPLLFVSLNDQFAIPLVRHMGDLIQLAGEQRVTLYQVTTKSKSHAAAVQERAMVRFSGLAAAIVRVCAHFTAQ